MGGERYGGRGTPLQMEEDRRVRRDVISWEVGDEEVIMRRKEWNQV